jgi:hypothetical protein
MKPWMHRLLTSALIFFPLSAWLQPPWWAAYSMALAAYCLACVDLQ